MVDDILVKVDRMSMAVSLKTREPLLDHKLLEFVARVPSSLKLHGATRKYLLRRYPLSVESHRRFSCGASRDSNHRLANG